MAITKKRKSPKAEKPKTQQSSVSKEVDVDKFSKDVRKLLVKHCPQYFSTEGSLITNNPMDSKKGFYLLFLERDESKPEDQRLQAMTFGQSMMMDDVTQLFVSVLKRLEKAESLEGIPRA